MKRNSYLFFLLMAAVLFTRCDDNLMELNKGDNPLEIAVSAPQLQLDAANPEAEALKLTWSSGTNRGTNAAISYTLQIDRAGNHFAGGLTLEMGREAYEKSFLNEELNNLLLAEFDATPGEAVTLEARVTATVSAEGIEPATSEPVAFVITPYKPITATLYLIGDATPNGWNADNATELRKVPNKPRTFSWTGSLTTGNFKFITTLGQFVPSYNKGTAEGTLYLRESFDDPYDEPFTITEPGTYTITANLATLTVTIAKGEGPAYTALWFVGNPTGWNFVPMQVDLLDPYLFHYNGDLSAGGEFKIGTQQGSWDAPFFRPPVNGTTEGEGLEVEVWAGDPDNKWNITGGVYKITLDTREMKIDIVPFTPYPMVYLVGDATPNGWDIGNATPMESTDNPNIFTWSGNLKGGELKFTLDKQSDWNGAWFIASEPDKHPSGQPEPMIFHYPGSGVDYKWKITEAGGYTILLDQLKETVTIQKQ